MLVAALSVFDAHGPLGTTFRGDVDGIAVTFEVMGIIAAVWLLRRLGRARFLLPAIGFIVGLHFIGLWRATDLSVFVWVAAAMCLICGLAVFAPETRTIDTRRVIAGFGSALVRWAAGFATLIPR